MGRPPQNADMAELVDALDLGSSDESRGGSSPSARTSQAGPRGSVFGPARQKKTEAPVGRYITE